MLLRECQGLRSAGRLVLKSQSDFLRHGCQNILFRWSVTGTLDMALACHGVVQVVFVVLLSDPLPGNSQCLLRIGRLWTCRLRESSLSARRRSGCARPAAVVDADMRATFPLNLRPGRGTGIRELVEALIAVQVHHDLVVLVDVKFHTLLEQFVENLVLVLAGQGVQPLDSIQFILPTLLIRLQKRRYSRGF